VDIQDYDGRTALHICATNNRTEILRLLIGAGADKTIARSDGKLPYELANWSEIKQLLKP
jgi:ankyrin repeat protein